MIISKAHQNCINLGESHQKENKLEGIKREKREEGGGRRERERD